MPSSILECPKALLGKANPLQELTYLLQRCKRIHHLNQIHCHLITTGFVCRPAFASKLVASFALSPFTGATSTALAIARSVRGLDAYTWNSVIRGCLEKNDYKTVILVYADLRRSGFGVDSYTILFVIKAIGSMPAICLDSQIHSHVLKSGFASEIIIQTAMIKMYSLLNELRSMKIMFDEMPQRDAVVWNSLVSAYSSKQPSEALKVLRIMLRQGIALTSVAVVSVVASCSVLRALKGGKSVHGYSMKKLQNLDVFIHNAFIDMYSKCGSVLSAEHIFRRMSEKTVVSWTSMINGYAHNNCVDEAIGMFKEMEYADMKPDEVTLLSAISLCSNSGRAELKDWIDHWLDRVGLGNRSIPVANALMVMYSKRGDIVKACRTFDMMKERTLVSWTAMIHGLAMHGHGVAALTRSFQMLREGLKPDVILFLSLLFGCSHSGLVEEGRKCFDMMVNDYGIEPWVDHYGCMVDLFCRAGLVTEAVEFVSNMPIEPDEIICRMLLQACLAHKLSNLAGWVQEKLTRFSSRSSEDYILLSNFRASVSEWDVVTEVRREMEARGAYKTKPGYSSVEIDDYVPSIN